LGYHEEEEELVRDVLLTVIRKLPLMGPRLLIYIHVIMGLGPWK
jgi:hypothetical protein